MWCSGCAWAFDFVSQIGKEVFNRVCDTENGFWQNVGVGNFAGLYMETREGFFFFRSKFWWHRRIQGFSSRTYAPVLAFETRFLAKARGRGRGFLWWWLKFVWKLTSRAPADGRMAHLRGPQGSETSNTAASLLFFRMGLAFRHLVPSFSPRLFPSIFVNQSDPFSSLPNLFFFISLSPSRNELQFRRIQATWAN
jgi:hypothetical protein